MCRYIKLSNSYNNQFGAILAKNKALIGTPNSHLRNVHLYHHPENQHFAPSETRNCSLLSLPGPALSGSEELPGSCVCADWTRKEGTRRSQPRAGTVRAHGAAQSVGLTWLCGRVPLWRPAVVPRAASCCFEPDHARRPTLCCTVQANAPNARWPATKGGHPGQDKGHASASASAPLWIPPRSGQLCGPSDRSGHELLISPDSPPGGGPRGGSWSPDARLPAPSLAFAKR